MMPGAISISLSSATISKVLQRAAVGKRRDRAGLPVRQHRRRVEAVAGRVDVADGDHRSVRGAVAGRRRPVPAPDGAEGLRWVRRMIRLPERAGRADHRGSARREPARQDERGGSTARATMPSCRPSRVPANENDLHYGEETQRDASPILPGRAGALRNNRLGSFGCRQPSSARRCGARGRGG